MRQALAELAGKASCTFGRGGDVPFIAYLNGAVRLSNRANESATVRKG